MPAQTNPADDSFFNDLSRRQSGPSDQAESPQDQAYGQEEIVEAGDVGILRARRIACVICRKRKLKCDGSKPSCGTCSRLKHKCAYDEVRKKSGPKRGYVKELEARLGWSRRSNTALRTQLTENQSPSRNPTQVQR